MSKVKLPTDCRTPEFTVSYPNIWTAKAVNEGDEAKFSISMVFDPDADLSEMKEKALNAAYNFWGRDKTRQLIEDGKFRSPFRDGTKEKRGDSTYEGKIFVGARSSDQPGVGMIVGSKYVPITEKLDFYAGCKAVATINFFAYDVKGNKGVAAGLNNLCKTGEGSRLSGRKPAEDDFAEFAKDMATASPGYDSSMDDLLG